MIVANDGAIEVYVNVDTASLRSAVQSATQEARAVVPSEQMLPPIRIVAGRAPTLAPLERVMARVTGQEGQLKAQGILLSEWGVDPRLNKVAIGVIGLPTAA
jgi:hypothetical protein